MTVSRDPSEQGVPSRLEPTAGSVGSEQPTTPMQAAPINPPAQGGPQPGAVQAPILSGGEQCPSCGARMAPDQRYCLNCGNRRGDPRLPFMDAVVFMDAVKRPRSATPPPPPPRERRGVSASTSLIAGVATLVLAIGVGVLIGRSGDDSSPPAASAQTQVITVEGGGGGGSTAPESNSGKAGGKGSGGGKKSKKDAAPIKTDSSGTSEAAAEVLKPQNGVNLPPPTTQPGDSCDPGTAGCSKKGEFTGDFFGGE